MYQLTDNDARLLAFISTADGMPIARIRQKFPRMKTIDQRLKILASSDVQFLEQKALYHTAETGSYYREDLGVYCLKPQGAQALEDYQRAHKLHIRDLWFKNAWLPILVSIAANIAIDGLRQLWPLIQQWLFHTPA